MEIIPAIYILDGRCVALYKSSYEQKETYFKSPLEMARHFEKQGAEKVYVVDLNGKKDNTFKQKEIVKKIADALNIPVIIEAGFNSMDEIQQAFNLGVSQIVMRPKATHLVRPAIQKFGAEKIIVLIQAKGGELIDGIKYGEDGIKTKPEEEMDVVDYAESLVPLGVKTVVYKDEKSEGTLIHPNYDEVDRLFLITGKDLKIYVSGGISEEKHIKLLKKIGAAAAIIGKAFYEKLITIYQAQSAAKD
jgi:phosphoribosylformimino-5-aminoimidazole carboxamide ribotide isomerase